MELPDIKKRMREAVGRSQSDLKNGYVQQSLVRFEVCF